MIAFGIGYAAFLDGTFAPSRRALDKPMAIACLRFLCSPFLRWCISVRTSCCALGPYLRRDDDFFFAPDDEERLVRLELERRDEDFFAELRERDEPRDDDFFFALDFLELERPFFFVAMNYSP
jgi:hypothetical protein